MIVVEKLTKQFNGQVVLNGIDLRSRKAKPSSVPAAPARPPSCAA
jgi:hypothetical protein